MTLREEYGKLVEIGRGTFGVVFTTACPETAVKKTFKGSDILAVEFEHGLAMSFAVTTTSPSFSHAFPNIPIPRVPWYQSSHGMHKPSAKDPWWIVNQNRLPSSNGDDVPNGVFLFERIPPVPRRLQESLIRQFWSQERRQAALDDPENRDCMIRPYLQETWAYYGPRRKGKRLNNEQKDSLRNFAVYLDDLEVLNIDACAVARQIAAGLAVAHWEAQQDLTDAEFVIAGKHQPTAMAARGHTLPLVAYDKRDDLGNRTILDFENLPLASSTKTNGSLHAGKPVQSQQGLPAGTQMWLVDFDKCNRVQVWDDSLAKDIKKLALGICANDPYYPSPLPDTQIGWDVFLEFTNTYIEAGRHILQQSFERAATSDGQLQKVLQRPAMVMREWTRVVMSAKKNNERELFDARIGIRREKGWVWPGWVKEGREEERVLTERSS